MNLIIQGPSGFHDAHIKAAVSEPGKDEYGRRMKKKKKKANDFTGIGNMTPTVYSLRYLSAAHACSHLSP